MPTVNLDFDDYDLDEFTRLASGYGQQEYGFVVTPNADHLIRYYDEPSFRKLYADAQFVLLDSRLLARMLRVTHRIRAKVCAGSDLTAKLFKEVINPDDPIVLIGSSDAQADLLRQQHQLRNLHHFNPPMGFVKNPRALDECLNYIESHSPFRFCLLAVGSPQQEVVAQQLKQRRRAKGLALCIGASVDFLTGRERRAPLWMQKLSCEWLFRLVQNPKRLAGRYLIRGPRIFALLPKFQTTIRRGACGAFDATPQNQSRLIENGN
jgi:exopolysaccharide biosynthesis WecB/TagA/CpsF family protein